MKIINSKLALHKSGYMKTKTIIYTFLLLLVLSVQRCQCKKDDTIPKPMPTPQPIPCDTCLPAITTTGQNTFGCRVNGKVWLPKTTPFNIPALWVEYTLQQLSVHGYNSDRKEYIDIDLGPILDTGLYIFYSSQLSMQWARFVNESSTIDFHADTIFKGNMHLTRFDPVNGFMSGTFDFDVYDKYHKFNGDTVHITDGRFDLHL